jgi:hypothetical protein
MKRMINPSDDRSNSTSPWWKKESTRMLRHGVVWVLVILAANWFVLYQMVVLSDQIRDHRITEDFSSPSLSAWEDPGNSKVINGVVQLLPGDEFSLKVRLVDLSFTVKGRRPENGSLIISYRAGGPGSYQVILNDRGVSLNRVINGVSNPLVSAPIDIPPGKWVTFHIITRANLHAVILDGKIVLRTFDPNPFVPGTIKLGYSGPVNTTGEYDNLKLLFDINPVVEEIKPQGLGGPLPGQ